MVGPGVYDRNKRVSLMLYCDFGCGIVSYGGILNDMLKCHLNTLNEEFYYFFLFILMTFLEILKISGFDVYLHG